MDKALNLLNAKLREARRVESCKNDYERLKTDEERFIFTIDLCEKFHIKPEIKIDTRSSKKSEDYRKAGNDLYSSPNARNHSDEILEHYTKSIVYAAPKSRDLALAYGNRSALLQRVKLYDHSILDIDRALSWSDCPDHIRVRLLARKINCLVGTGKNSTQKIEECSEEALNLIESMQINETTRGQLRASIELAKIRDGVQRQLFDEEFYKPEIPMDNSELPGVSSSLKVCYDEKFGRHVRATRKILPGEVLSVQKGYATILAPDLLYTYCSHCLKQTWSSVPCDRCVYAVYCDKKCRDDAWVDHHEFECGVVGALLNLEFNLLGLLSLRLAIRAVKQAGGFDKLKEKIKTLENLTDRRTEGFIGTPPTLTESDYSSVYVLTRNSEKRSVPDLFGRSFNAVYIVYCLATMTDFLGEKLPREMKSIKDHPWSSFLGGLITRHQQIIPSNAHTVSETVGLSDRDRGSALIPFLSLFNHSCAPSVTRTHYGKYIVLYASQTLEPDEQVYDNYGLHYAVLPRSERQKKTRRQFFFTCECIACTEDWPLFPNLQSWTKQRGMSKKSTLVVGQALKNLDDYVRRAEENDVTNVKKDIEDLSLMLKVLYEHVKLPKAEVNTAVETLKRFYDITSMQHQSLNPTTDDFSALLKNLHF